MAECEQNCLHGYRATQQTLSRFALCLTALKWHSFILIQILDLILNQCQLKRVIVFTKIISKHIKIKCTKKQNNHSFKNDERLKGKKTKHEPTQPGSHNM
jgi:hypothetical protein